MKLFSTPVSPYARKVRIVIAEKGLSALIEMVSCAPFEVPADLVTLNPLSKVPTLQLDDGNCLYDSPVICEYLDSLGEGPSLYPSGA